jgi:hypothetical protein
MCLSYFLHIIISSKLIKTFCSQGNADHTKKTFVPKKYVYNKNFANLFI